MKKQFFLRKERNQKSLILISMMIIPAFLSACSSYGRGEDLVAADEMMQGPGIFSGDKGGFYIVGGKEKAVASKSVSTMNAAETSMVIDKKLEQLKRDQMELEALKKQLNKKL